MNDVAPLFITGVARSGTTLLAKMLDAHPKVSVASDPLLPFFHSLRNAVILRHARSEVKAEFDPAKPIADYYFRRNAPQLVDTVLSGDLNEPLEQGQWNTLLGRIRARCAYECQDLLAHLESLKKPTYRQSLDEALRIINVVRNDGKARWVGVKDVWILELFPLLARAYPNARFVVVGRDPRGSCASALCLEDVSQRPHPLSFARHCRKHIAFAYRQKEDPALAGRTFFCSYERLVSQPEDEMQALSAFLGLPYSARMLDSRLYRNPSTGLAWPGNSSYTDNLSSISSNQVSAWQGQLPLSTIRLVEFIAGYEMKLEGYELSESPKVVDSDSSVFREIVSSERGAHSWRTDFEDAFLDYSLERTRSEVLRSPKSFDEDHIRRSFLFGSVHSAIQAQNSD